MLWTNFIYRSRKLSIQCFPVRSGRKESEGGSIFSFQDTRPEIKVDLAQLSIDGSAIRFFKALMEENEGLTWERLRYALLECYGVVCDRNVFEQLASFNKRATWRISRKILSALLPKYLVCPMNNLSGTLSMG